MFLAALTRRQMRLALLLVWSASVVTAWMAVPPSSRTTSTNNRGAAVRASTTTTPWLRTAATTTTTTTLFADSTTTSSSASTKEEEEEKKEEFDYTVPEDPVVLIKPKAMKRMRELRQSELKDPKNDKLVLRMGVRNGGCSGMSYVMDFSTETAIQEDDAQDYYPDDKIVCVVDAKSMLYLYGLELDYSTDLIGGGFKFFNPNAEESCGCGSSFGV